MALRFLKLVGCKTGQGVSLGFKGAGGLVWGTCLRAPEEKGGCARGSPTDALAGMRTPRGQCVPCRLQ